MKFRFIEPEILSPKNESEQPVSYVRKEFDVSKAKKVMLHITALGVFKAYINGKPIDDCYLLPGFTNYRKRLQYKTYDITSMLSKGRNAIGVVIGDGWYRGALGAFGKRFYYGNKIKLACSIELVDDFGTKEITTDESWKATQNGPIIQNDLKTYETVDMRKEMHGWNDVGFDDKDWHNCVMGDYNGKCVPYEGEDILEHESFAAKVLKTPNGETVLDFGQNLAGHIEFTVNGKSGDTVSIKMGEVLDENGNFTTKNLEFVGKNQNVIGALGQLLTYTLKDGKQTYKSMFLISGYRYAKLDNWPEEVKAENFRSIAVYSAFATVSRFECSNEMINKLVENSRWSQKSNFVDIPTDCPQRERAGWTGDINVFTETAIWYTDVKKFLLKWLRDAVSLQKEDGNLPYIVPEVPMSMGKTKRDKNGEIKSMQLPNGSAGWSDAIINIPMLLYKFYGDNEAIKIVYECAKKYITFELKRAKRKHILNLFKGGEHFEYILDTGFHFGEWLEPGHSMQLDGLKAIFFPDSEVATAWLYHSVKEVSEMAEILNKNDEHEYYLKIADKIKEAYRKEFIKKGTVISDRQCRFVRPVYMEIASEEEAKKIVSDLNDMIIKNDYKIGTGFLTTYKVLYVLSKYGYNETIYRLLLNEKCPGWLYELNKGATTIWEDWLGIDENNVPKNSMNHYSPGASLSFMFAGICGINPTKPGFEEILIMPCVSKLLSYAKAEYRSVKGNIVSKWDIKDDLFTLHVEIPDVPATVVLPDGSKYSQNERVKDYSCIMK